MSVEIANYATILMELAKAVKMHNFYPQGHPQLDTALDKCFRHLKNSIDAQGDIKWKVDQRGFYDGKVPILPGNNELAGLAKKLFFRRVKELTMTHLLTQRDLKVFLEAVKADPEELQAKGGVESFFAAMDISGILLNEMRYEDLKRLKAELEKKKEDEEKVIAEQRKKDEELAGESARSEEQEDKQQKEKPAEESLEELLARIQNENDLLRYNDLSIRMIEKAAPLLQEKEFDRVFPVMLLFFEHSQPSSGKTEGIRSTALEKLKDLFTREFLQYLAGRTGAKDETHRAAIQSVLVCAGEEAAEILLDAIIEAPEALTRRNLFNALVLFGSALRPHAEAKLRNPKWFVVRQMAALLGDIGGPDSIPALEAAYANEDVRVKKEVLKSLVKIGTRMSTEFIISKLGEEDQSLVAQAIISLGIIKDPIAVEPLAGIALRREAFAEPSDASMEAIKALGMIGDARAVTHLAKILFRKVWFNRKANEEARSLAAYSLGMIGTPEALKAVEEAFEGSTGELHMACRKILEGRERSA